MAKHSLIAAGDHGDDKNPLLSDCGLSARRITAEAKRDAKLRMKCYRIAWVRIDRREKEANKGRRRKQPYHLMLTFQLLVKNKTDRDASVKALAEERGIKMKSARNLYETRLREIERLLGLGHWARWELWNGVDRASIIAKACWVHYGPENEAETEPENSEEGGVSSTQ